MPSAETETAYAKINLALHVRERMADGYHRIETLFLFAEDGDELSVAPSDALTLEIDGPFAAGLSSGADNLVMRAALALREAFGIGAGAALWLTKKLPIASGIGGGSADAAAALRLLARLWGIARGEPRLVEVARVLGADVPACLASKAQFGAGRGDELIYVDASALAGAPLLLANPGAAVATGAVFAGWDGVDRGALEPSIETALAGRNDLETPAIEIAPAIAPLLGQLLAQPGVRVARMSGSGATCFAIFESEAARDAAAEAVAGLAPWCLKTRLR